MPIPAGVKRNDSRSRLKVTSTATTSHHHAPSQISQVTIAHKNNQKNALLKNNTAGSHPVMISQQKQKSHLQNIFNSEITYAAYPQPILENSHAWQVASTERKVKKMIKCIL